MLKKLTSIVKVSSTITLAAFLSGTSAQALREGCDPHDEIAISQAAFHLATSKYGELETRWWNDFTTSGKKILPYVNDIASKDPKAAMWFLVTGGKYGFSGKQANQDEAELILSAMKKVAQELSKSSGGDALEEWARINVKHHAGHLHLKQIYKELDELKQANDQLTKDVLNLTKRVGVLETQLDLEQRTRESTVKVAVAEALAKQREEIRKEIREEFEAERKQREEKDNKIIHLIEEKEKESANLVEKIREEHREDTKAFRSSLELLMKQSTDTQAFFLSKFTEFDQRSEEKIDKRLKEFREGFDRERADFVREREEFARQRSDFVRDLEAARQRETELMNRLLQISQQPQQGLPPYSEMGEQPGTQHPQHQTQESLNLFLILGEQGI